MGVAAWRRCLVFPLSWGAASQTRPSTTPRGGIGAIFGRPPILVPCCGRPQAAPTPGHRRRYEVSRRCKQRNGKKAPGGTSNRGPSSGQSPHCSPRPGGQVSLSSLAPPLPNGPASLGSIWVPVSPVLGRFKGWIVKAGAQHEPNEVGRVGRRRHKGADRLFTARWKERGADFGSTTIPLLD